MTQVKLSVATEAELESDIAQVDKGAYAGDSVEIDLANSITLGSELDALNLPGTTQLIIDGQGFALDGNNAFRGVFAYAGEISLQNLVLSNMRATGGAGGAGGGGGGAGLGGSLFVAANATVTLSQVSFSHAQAVGGQGGAATSQVDPYQLIDGFGRQSITYLTPSPNERQFTGGGGGGLGGSGGSAFKYTYVDRPDNYVSQTYGYGGGGGIGGGAFGASFQSVSGSSFQANPGSGSVPGADPGGASGGNPGGANAGGGADGAKPGSSSGQPTNGGFDQTTDYAGGGGVGAQPSPADGSDGGGGFGGGGAGGSGPGGFGGGGGGAPYGYATSTGPSGPGSAPLPSGAGGFAGGAGGGANVGVGYDGGFGGGGGGNAVLGQNAMDGTVSNPQGGGGGAALGGAIFVQQGGTLIFGAGSITGSALTPGQGSDGGAAGQTFGAGIFVQGDQSITFAPIAGATASVGDVIADQNGSIPDYADLDYQGAADAPGDSASGAARVVVGGAGTTQFAVANTYTGGTILQSGTLDLQVAGAAGSAAITFSVGPGQTATLALEAAAQPASFDTYANTLDGFGTGAALDLRDFSPVGATALAVGDTLTVTNTAHEERFRLTNAATGVFVARPDATGAGTLITEIVACYLAGSLVRTPLGDRAVEDLAIGDLVVTASGAHRPIRWLGRRSYAGRFASRNPDVLPICFKAGALGDGLPTRDLRVSPRHAMFLDGVLIPAECLVNGVSIVQTTRLERIDYHHIELDSHDVLIVEGALSESFVDDNSRRIFHNANEYAEKDRPEGPAETIYCVPRITDGFVLEAIRRRLAAEADDLISQPRRAGVPA